MAGSAAALTVSTWVWLATIAGAFGAYFVAWLIGARWPHEPSLREARLDAAVALAVALCAIVALRAVAGSRWAASGRAE